MVLELKLRKIGKFWWDSWLPKDAPARLDAGEGDAARLLTDAADGGIRLTSANPEFARKMNAAQSISRRYRNALKELAK